MNSGFFPFHSCSGIGWGLAVFLFWSTFLFLFYLCFPITPPVGYCIDVPILSIPPFFTFFFVQDRSATREEVQRNCIHVTRITLFAFLHDCMDMVTAWRLTWLIHCIISCYSKLSAASWSLSLGKGPWLDDGGGTPGRTDSHE